MMVTAIPYEPATFRHTLRQTAVGDALRDSKFERLAEEQNVPLINVKIIEGVFDASQKRQMIEKLTDAMVTIEGENMRPVTWVVVEEVKSGDWGIAGNPLATADVKALAAGVAVG
jgi:4-oxalocrotonate tautomerase